MQFAPASTSASVAPIGNVSDTTSSTTCTDPINSKKKTDNNHKRRRKPKGPVPDFGFFERDKRLALAKSKRCSHGDSADGSNDKLTEWEQRLLSTSWKSIKRLPDAQSDMVRRYCLSLVKCNAGIIDGRPFLPWMLQAKYYRQKAKEDLERWKRDCPG